MVNNVRGMDPVEPEAPSPATGARCRVRYSFYEKMWRKMDGDILCPVEIARGPADELREWLWDRLYDGSPEEDNAEVTDTEDLEIGEITDIPRLT